MKGKRKATLIRVMLAAAAAFAALMIPIACGGDEEEASRAPTETPGAESAAAGEGVQEAKRLVEQEQAPPVAVNPPAEPVDAAAANGKTLMVIPVSGALPVAQVTNAALEEALQTAGAEMVEIDGRFQVNVWARAIEQAVSRRVDAIALEGINTDAVRAPLARANEEGIPTISAFSAGTGFPPQAEQDVGVVARVTFSWVEIGERMAHYVIADSDGTANVVIISSSDNESSGIMVDAAKAEFDRLCPECKVRVVDNPQTQGPARLETRTRTLVNQDRTIDYMMPVYDNMALAMVPAIHAAGAAERVKIVTSNGTPAVLEFIKRRDVVVADIGANIPWSGWGVADQFFRLVNGQPPVEEENVPTRTFSVNNIDEIDLQADQSTWFGPDTWKQKYKETWGVD